MEIQQEDQGASLVDFVSALEAYLLKTEGLFPTVDGCHKNNNNKKELKD